ncbi:MAG: tRNA (N6-isopentenyl adenosine(37)-C2)-methylthiotransferase MiaB [Chloroflexota bacterium]|nr:tRNA (N6-isopentenyl adenosine(37)-C2)-methylthiotransferase MiaB [Dehalococcoidia bacterium]MDW8253033.1 tRNA (N6-isopentenyl adenosine(37)-C2)-methylthiotransferase MiaB [Chloroflexota bacterium]
MPRYYIWTVGCQMNVADSERLGAALEQLGYVPSARPDESDVVVLNTCSVRRAAEEKAINQLHLLKRLKQRRPELTLALVGCMVPKDSSALAKEFPFVDVFCRPQQFAPLLKIAADKIGSGDGCLDPGRLPLPTPKGPTAFVPISHGCNKVCSFCVIPYRRGTEVSRPLAELVDEVRALVRRGVVEVTLLGQNVDSYGGDLPDRPDLADLLTALNEIDGLERIRFLTSHPRDMSEKLIRAVAELPKVCEHINLPVQSGDDEILRSMRRGYTAAEYRELVAKIRELVPGVSMATDVIVGYPGESERAFQNTYDLLAELQIDVVHVAAYSPRPGTLAAKLPDDVPPAEKKARLHAIERLQERISAQFNARYLGQTVEVLVEGKKNGRWFGRTRTNKLVFWEQEGDLTGTIVPVTIERTGAWSLQGPQTLRLAVLA